MNIASNFKLSAIDYANQGNAILGIRDAGKTYTAMKVAEELLENNIPIICYDPVGIWKNLKVGVGKHKGYPIVTAGGSGCDILLTELNASDIVRAAMKENVSLVIDLYSPELINKSKWIKIVQETIDLLMYENKLCGSRHIFLEEAAEFIPQKLQPQHARVYASLERLARMGRNARLGYTLINQRAEEINKAILEISALILLHKQVGKNSLSSIQKWLDLLQVENVKDIIKALPTLKQGECWVVGQTDQPQLIQILSRNTFHPNPKMKIEVNEASNRTIDVSAFVEKMNKQLIKEAAKPKIKTTIHESATQNTDEYKKTMDAEAAIKNKEIAELKHKLSAKDKIISQLQKQLDDIRKIVETRINYHPPIKIVEDKASIFTPVVRSQPTNGASPSGGALRMLKAAAMFYPNSITKMRMAALSRLSHTSGSYGTYLSTLKRIGFITAAGNEFTITEKGLEAVGEFEPLPQDPMQLIELWADVIGSQSGAARMLRELGSRYPSSYSKSELGKVVNMSHTSGSFGTYLSTLKRNGLIEVNGQNICAAKELFE